MEDIQFCGLYFCGIDTTADNGVKKSAYADAHEDTLRRRKEEMKQEEEDTFLGKVISCGRGGYWACSRATPSSRWVESIPLPRPYTSRPP